MPRLTTRPIDIDPGSAVGIKLREILERNSMPVTECGCQIWLRGTKGGYGTIGANGLGRNVTTHRLSYTLYKGPIPEGALVLHHCDVPPCINPDHLFLGDDWDNAADRDAKGRNVAMKGEDNGEAKLTDEDVLSILRDPRKHWEIARDYRVSVTPIMRIKTGLGWKHLTGETRDIRGTPTGEGHGMVKLSEDDVISIRGDTRLGRLIAADFGISESTVSLIRNRKIWRHLSQ